MSTYNDRLPALEAAAKRSARTHPALQAAALNPRLNALGKKLVAEEQRRLVHRILSQQAYLINPMNGDVQVGPHEIVEFVELLALVSQFNKGELPHSDDWFTIEDIDEKRYPMELFYQFIN